MTDALVMRLETAGESAEYEWQRKLFREAAAALAEMEAQRGRDQYTLMVNAHDIDEARAEAAGLRDALDGITKGDFRIESWVTVRDERDEARAEAAALREALVKMTAHYCPDPNCYASARAGEALSKPGPGAAYQERVKKLEAVVAAARIDLNTVATMPWNRDDHGHPQWTGLQDPLWSEWIHGPHAAVEDALAALDNE